MGKKYCCLLFFLFFFIMGIFNVNAASYKASDLGVPTLSSLKQSGQTVTLSYKNSASTTICKAMRCGIMLFEDKTDKIYRVSNTSTSFPIRGLQKGKTYAFSVAQYYIDEKGVYKNYKLSEKKLVTIPGNSSSTSTSVSTPKLTKVSRYSYNSPCFIPMISIIFFIKYLIIIFCINKIITSIYIIYIIFSKTI